jgi:hypothetical protein
MNFDIVQLEKIALLEQHWYARTHLQLRRRDPEQRVTIGMRRPHAAPISA